MIVIDTTPLVALCDRRDAYHGRAVQHLAKLAGTPFATCDGVVAEACFLLVHRSARRRLHALLTELDVLTLPAEPDRSYRDDVFKWLMKYEDHDPDWTDGCLAVLSGRESAIRVWTYDSEFRTTWRRPNGTRIPLAVQIR